MEFDDYPRLTSLDSPLTTGDEVCPRCGEPVDVRDVYCPNCQELLTPSAEADPEALYRGGSQAARGLMTTLAAIAVGLAVIALVVVALVLRLAR